MILATLSFLAAANSIWFYITKFVFIIGGLAFAGAGGFALKNKDPNSTITPGKAIAFVIIGGLAVIFGLFFTGVIIS